MNARRVIIIDGNSLSDPAVSSLSSDLKQIVGQSAPVKTVARSGRTTTNMLRHASDLVDSLYRPGRVNILVVWEITNDLYHGARREDAYKRFAQYRSDRKRYGWKVIVLTVLARHGEKVPATFERDRVAINSLLTAHYREYSEALCDVAAIPQLRNPTDRAYFKDGTHLTPEGYRLVAERVATAQAGL